MVRSPFDTQKKDAAPPSLCTYILMFTLLSLGGWLFEKVGRYLLYHSTADRGFLTLPLCPIYGTCVLLIGLLLGSPRAPSRFLGKLLHRPFSILPRLLLYFLAVTLLSTAVELAVGLIFLWLGIPLWDYSERFGNLFGVICPSFSLLWGVLLTLFMGLSWDRLSSTMAKIPSRTQRWLAITSVGMIGADFLFNCLFLFIRGNRFWFL